MSEGQLQWSLILTTVLGGVAFAVATIFGWIHGHEGGVALGLLLLCAALLARAVASRPFVHGFLGGFATGEVAVLLQAIFLETYFSHNPEYRAIEIPFGLDARIATFALSPINAVIAGLIVGSLTWGMHRLRRCPAADGASRR